MKDNQLTERESIVNPSFAKYSKNQGKRSSYLYCVLILVTACLLVYNSTFSNEFQMKWDDWWVVMNEYTEGGWNNENISRIITEFYHGQYAPINELFYLTIYSLFEYDPFWFHAASLVIHIFNVLLVFSLINRLLFQAVAFNTRSRIRIAFITALLMAINPFLVESVAWVSASKCILFAFFYLLALHAYLSYLRTSRLFPFILVIIFFILSFGGKEQAVTLPLCLLLFDYILKRKMNDKNVWLEKIPFFLLALAFTAITIFSQQYNGEGVLSKQLLHPWHQNLVFATYSISEYFVKTIIPLRLSYLYPFPNPPGQPLPLQLWAYPVILVLVTVGFWKFWQKRWVTFGVLFFLIQMTVVCNIIPTSRYAIIADRYVYLAAVGVCFLIAYLYDQAVQRKVNYIKYLYAGSVAYLLCLSIYAHFRVNVWHDSDILKMELSDALKSRKDYDHWKKKYDLPD